MILSGKMSMESGIWKDDPVLKLQRDLDKVNHFYKVLYLLELMLMEHRTTCYLL